MAIKHCVRVSHDKDEVAHIKRIYNEQRKMFSIENAIESAAKRLGMSPQVVADNVDLGLFYFKFTTCLI